MGRCELTQVRNRCGDSASELFDDGQITEAIDSAEDWLLKKDMIPVSPLEIRLESLKAAEFLFQDYLDNLSDRPVNGASEQGSSISLVDIQARYEKLKMEVTTLLFEVQGSYYEAQDAEF